MSTNTDKTQPRLVESTSGDSEPQRAPLVLTDELVKCAHAALERLDETICSLDSVDRLISLSIGHPNEKAQAAMLHGALALLTVVRGQMAACTFEPEGPCFNSAIATVSYAIRNTAGVKESSC